MGFIGDIFLPKHLFRTIGAMGGLSKNGQDEQRPGPRQVVAAMVGQASDASQAIGTRLFKGKGWASRRIPGTSIKLGGVVIFAGYGLLVGALAWHGGSSFLKGLQRIHPVVPAVAGGYPGARPGVPVEGWRDAH